jgi:hypothetical protein
MLLRYIEACNGTSATIWDAPELAAIARAMSKMHCFWDMSAQKCTCQSSAHDRYHPNEPTEMKTFECSRCRNRIYFENVTCLKCGVALGFDAEAMAMVPFELASPSKSPGKSPASKSRRRLKYCANASHGVCNWLTTHDQDRCLACQMNRTIPNLSEPGSLTAWRDLELAKKRFVYGLLRFGLPLATSRAPSPKVGSDRRPLTFDFARNAVTGHRDGVITIDVLEADAVERERLRQRFGEPYRALLGHLRHESGHFYWSMLVDAAGQLDEYRRLFSDERQDYATALVRHHAGARADWPAQHVSAYASSHPWEDWAETWAHYLHLVDAVDTAEAEGMEPHTSAFSLSSIFANKNADVFRDVAFSALMERWTPLALGMNSLSRSMGHDDFYPFIIPPPVVEKLAFVHRIVRAAAS